MIPFNKLFEVALGSRRPKSTYVCLQIELDCIAQVIAFQKLVSPSSQTLSNTTNFSKFQNVCGYLIHFVVFSNYLNCTKRIENCSMVAPIVSKYRKISAFCQ